MVVYINTVSLALLGLYGYTGLLMTLIPVLSCTYIVYLFIMIRLLLVVALDPCRALVSMVLLVTWCSCI